MNRQARRSAQRLTAKRQGHPARVTRRERAKRFTQPDASEAAIQELNRLMRLEISMAPDGDGLISGPLTVAARYAAPRLAEIHGLTDEEHTTAIERWLVGNLGEVISAFDPKQYFAWRQACVERAATGQDCHLA